MKKETTELDVEKRHKVFSLVCQLIDQVQYRNLIVNSGNSGGCVLVLEGCVSFKLWFRTWESEKIDDVL